MQQRQEPSVRLKFGDRVTIIRRVGEEWQETVTKVGREYYTLSGGSRIPIRKPFGAFDDGSRSIECGPKVWLCEKARAEDDAVSRIAGRMRAVLGTYGRVPLTLDQMQRIEAIVIEAGK